MTRRARFGDDGSILPLVLGFAILAIALILVCASATSLYVAQKQLDAVADAAALAGADGFTLTLQDGEPQATLTSAQVRAQAEALVDIAPGEPALVTADTPDGRSARVSVTAAWYPPLFSVFVPDGVRLTATATRRTGLR